MRATVVIGGSKGYRNKNKSWHRRLTLEKRRDRLTDGQTDRQTDRDKETHRDREPERERERERDLPALEHATF